MMDLIRVSAMPFGDAYFAVIHRPGSPDEIMDGPDGRPARFATAYLAQQAGLHSLQIAHHSDAPQPLPDPMGIETWREQKARELAEEQERAFGPAVEFRRRRR